jgi:DNA-binding NarL/FixJ family response regulator
MIGIMLLDDHALVRQALGRLLNDEPDLRVMGSFDQGAAAVAFAVRERPEVAILDVAMPGASGIEVAVELRAASPQTRLLMLSMHDRADYVEQALRAGADGYVLKECAGAELVAAVRAVHAGRRYLSARLERSRGEEPEDPLERLSARELEVLKLVVEGNTSYEVATMLGLSPKSIDTYRSRLMNKLDIDHLAALVKFAIRRGLTSP